MYVKTYGSGKRQFMCFHGWGGDHREFIPLARRAPSGVCLHCVDLPGYGRSAKPQKWDMQSITDEAAAYLAAQDAGPFTLIGFCSGVVPALMLPRSAPDRVTRIVMIDPFAFVPWYFRIFLWGAVGRLFYSSAFMTPVGRSITDSILKRLQTSDADFTNAFIELDHNVTLRYLQLLHRMDTKKTLQGLHIDIDVLYGENTFKSVGRSIGIYKRFLPQIKTQKLAGVGHLPMIEGAKQLAAAIFGGETEVRNVRTKDSVYAKSVE